MNVVDFRQFQSAESEQWSEFVESVRAGLASFSRTTLIKNLDFESNQLLIRLANSLGRPHRGYNLADHPLEDDFIYRVEVRHAGIRDENGRIIYSSTADAFPCHTDGANRPVPYDAVLMHCIRPARSGGETILVRLDQLIEHLETKVMDILRENGYPFHFGKAPIISGEGDGIWIRYNAQDIAFYSQKYDVPLTTHQQDVLSRLDLVLKEFHGPSQNILLRPADCLVIDNRKVLHGRTAFPQNSQRLIKRLRLFW